MLLHALLRLVIRCTVIFYTRLVIRQPYCLLMLLSMLDCETTVMKSVHVGVVFKKYLVIASIMVNA